MAKTHRTRWTGGNSSVLNGYKQIKEHEGIAYQGVVIEGNLVVIAQAMTPVGEPRGSEAVSFPLGVWERLPKGTAPTVADISPSTHP